MATSTDHPRRRVLLAIASLGLVPLTGCMSPPARPATAGEVYCHSLRRSRRTVRACTSGPVPSDAIEAEAKRFEAAADSLTIYVLRNRWGDAWFTVPMAVDGVDGATSIPKSLIRIRLKPGMHRLSVRWDEGNAHLDVSGAAGEVRFVELIGRGWAWRSSFNWRVADAQELQARALASKLVADIDLDQ